MLLRKGYDRVSVMRPHPGDKVRTTQSCTIKHEACTLTSDLGCVSAFGNGQDYFVSENVEKMNQLLAMTCAQRRGSWENLR